MSIHLVCWVIDHQVGLIPGRVLPFYVYQWWAIPLRIQYFQNDKTQPHIQRSKPARSYQFFVLYYSRLAVLLNCISLCIAYKTYQSKIPNGDSVPNPCSDDSTAKWNGVGHIAMAGAGDRNIFGIAFKAAGAVSDNGAQSVISQKNFYTPNSRKDNLLVVFLSLAPRCLLRQVVQI